MVCHCSGSGMLAASLKFGGRRADQNFLPLVGEGVVVAIPAAKHNPAELGDHEQRVLDDVGWHVVAVDQHSNTCFMRAVRVANAGEIQVLRRQTMASATPPWQAGASERAKRGALIMSTLKANLPNRLSATV